MLILSELTSAILYRLASCTVFVNFLLGKSRSGSFAVQYGDHFRCGIICGPIWGSFVVRDHLRSWDHLRTRTTSAFSVFFVSYRYKAKVNLTEGRCPRSKAMVFADNGMTSVTVPNVNIGDCDYTIAFWTRLLDPSARAYVSGLSRSRKIIYLDADAVFKSVYYCHEVSVGHVTCLHGLKVLRGVVNHWNHFAVTCEQDNRVKLFVNGHIVNMPIRENATSQWLISDNGISPLSNEMFVIGGRSYRTVMDLHILGFALPPVEIFDLYRGQYICLFYEEI